VRQGGEGGEEERAFEVLVPPLWVRFLPNVVPVRDLAGQAADPVGQPSGLAGQVVIETDQDFQLGQRLLADIDRRRVCGRVRAASAIT
jgi:hypothetical protein